MELTGNIKDIYRNVATGMMTVTLEVNEGTVLAEGYDAIKDSKLSIRLAKYRARRSLDANAYFHVLLGRIAEKLNISNACCKNILIARYGQPMILPSGEVMIYKSNAPVEYMRELEDIHTVAVKSDGKATFYKVMRGSHEYDSAEMSRLINGTVDEAKELGIETLTPDELARINAEWKARNA